MKSRWTAILAITLTIIFGGTAISPVISGALGWGMFGLIFVFIPYLVYKSFSASQFILAIAFASPLVLGPSLGYWMGFWENRILNAYGKRAEGVVSSAWISSYRNSKNKLFRVRFHTPSGTHETTSFDNNKDFQAGDRVSVRYVPTNPQICRIVE
uniref:DUF3592 domain-containing protein n=1 Tax=Hymenobacter cellulosilyticus TaxID=2932248 RepID=UPI0035CBBFF4